MIVYRGNCPDHAFYRIFRLDLEIKISFDLFTVHVAITTYRQMVYSRFQRVSMDCTMKNLNMM